LHKKQEKSECLSYFPVKLNIIHEAKMGKIMKITLISNQGFGIMFPPFNPESGYPYKIL